MLISVKLLSRVLKIKPKGVLHVGAHRAEERDQYKAFGWGSIFWIDASDENVEYVRNLIAGSDDFCEQALIWSESNKIINFNVSSNSESSSVFEFGSHAKNYPDVKITQKIELRSSRLDDLIPDSFNFNLLNLDIQGAELEALKGFKNLIKKVEYVYTEVNKEEVYKGCTLVNDLDEYLKPLNFKRVATKWDIGGWGDALYIREELLNISLSLRLFVLRILISDQFYQLFFPVRLLLLVLDNSIGLVNRTLTKITVQLKNKFSQ